MKEREREGDRKRERQREIENDFFWLQRERGRERSVGFKNIIAHLNDTTQTCRTQLPRKQRLKTFLWKFMDTI